MKKFVFTILLIIMILISSSCDRAPRKYQGSFLFLFNTITEVVAYTKNEDEFSELANFIHDELEIYHQLYDIYNSYDGINNIKSINDNAGKEPIKVDKKIIDLLKYCVEAYELSNGTVNVGMGSVLKIWHDYRTQGIDDPVNAALPPRELLEEANKHTNLANLIIDEANSTVFLSDSNMRLDVGAVAKGYATEQVVQKAIDRGYTDFLLSVGGNVRAVGGKGKEKSPWSVGVKNPDKESEKNSLFALALIDLSLVASGNYERYYTVDGKEYHHIIDPDTLMPSEYFVAVSIVCEDSGMADVLSTAIYNMSYKEGLSLIESLKDTEALWIFHDGSVKYTPGFEELIIKRY
ncbi:MAG TPA: FAD:protein FMN transferase [Clostridiales bacterium]|jgi:thiamine biosynthesis lipoprotein|nr:FAD:protein FMN transferase [Clostridiales bacterium]